MPEQFPASGLTVVQPIGVAAIGLTTVPGVVAALTLNARVRAVAFASVGGVAYAYVSVLICVVSQSVQQGGLGTFLLGAAAHLSPWTGAALIACALAAASGVFALARHPRFEPGDVNALAQRLHTLVHDAPMRARMGAASSEIISRHTLAATPERFEGLYARAMGRTAPLIALAA
ncbi:hypothetical protein SAMN05216188_110187 [Lentzea xinjiangensis]|uniref:Uncharacterized protein n=1 Tax=Lentzea xinjiangensis TaxID=402600 RepID=A0A1H9NG50_9PSEU|nr:hypothetical protein [Lentzea xinjiangensis]SER34747.1 hypothetical protein SAMN05216188_110187 [Lentzea xinjiangensis]